jgi:hypothetical protein
MVCDLDVLMLQALKISSAINGGECWGFMGTDKIRPETFKQKQQHASHYGFGKISPSEREALIIPNQYQERNDE